jgi:hypothetical protein
VPRRQRRFNHFQGGSIYWTPETDAHEVHGAIHEEWSQLGWERGFLGYPTSDETPDSYGTGRLSHFQGRLIYWSPQTGAQEAHGVILEKWLSLDAERSLRGPPDNGRGDESGELDLGDLLCDKSEQLPADQVELVVPDDMLRRLLETLLSRARQILERRHGLDGREPATFEELGCACNVTRDRIRRIEETNLTKLRALPHGKSLK